ncbi:metallophosphoesterase [bacterium]|nr:metallophosphoesterase [bacterium]
MLQDSEIESIDSEVFEDAIMENMGNCRQEEDRLVIKDPAEELVEEARDIIKSGSEIEEDCESIEITDDESESEEDANSSDLNFIVDDNTDLDMDDDYKENEFMSTSESESETDENYSSAGILLVSQVPTPDLISPQEKKSFSNSREDSSVSQDEYLDDIFSNMKMEKENVTCFIFTDVHFSGKYPIEENNFIEACTKAAIEAKPDFIVDMGDLLHYHNRCDVKPFNRVLDLLTNMAKIAPVYKIIGNHELLDQSEFQSEDHFFNPYKFIPGITVIDKAQVITINNFDFFFTPFVPKGKLLDALNSIEGVAWDTCIAGFGHQEIKGASQGGFISEDGDEWSKEYPPFITGHFHEEQHLKDIGVNYPGSSRQTSFGETHKKYAWKVTFDELSPDYNVDKIDLKLRTKRTFNIDIEDINNFDLKKAESQDIRLKVKGTREQLRVFGQSTKHKEVKKAGVKIMNIPIIETFSKGENSCQNYSTILKNKVSESSDIEVQKQYKQLVNV